MSAAEWARSRFGDVRGPIALWMDTVASRPSWARAFGVALVALLALTALSGIGLSFTYAPSTASAWASVYFTEFVLGSGWYVRSLHVAAAEGSIVIGVVGLVLATLEGRYRGRRDLAFYMHAVMIAIALAFCITGNPLRWDNRGYYGFLVETNIAGELPGGKLLRALALGGSEAGNFTLTRLYALHTLALPLVCAGLLWVWSRSSRAASEAEGAPRETGSQLVRDGVATLVTVLGVAVLAYLVRAPLESPADPIATYNARPEWYFSSLYVLRNAVPASMQAIVAGGAPVVVGALIFAVPWLDRDPDASFGRRAPALLALLVPVGLAVILTLVAMRHDAKDPDLQKSHAAAMKTTHRALQVAQVQGIPPAGALAMMRNDPVTRGEDLFRDKCATCHKLGDLGPADGKLTAPTLDGFGTEQWAVAVMENPDAPDLFGNTAYRGRMPSLTRPPTDPALAKDWKATSKGDIDAMAAFLAGEAAESPRSQEGAKLIKQRCTGCHLFRGATDDDGGFGPELGGWGSTAWLRAQIANPGTNATYRAASMSTAMEGHMPRSDADLSADDIDLLARFVRGRGRGRAAK